MKNNRMWTNIILKVGDTEIQAVFNDSQSSKELLARLPYTVRLQKYEYDYCGVMNEPLNYDKGDLHNGWVNGEIAFAANGNYFTILYKGQEVSQKHGNLVTLGELKSPLSVMDSLDDDISVTIALK